MLYASGFVDVAMLSHNGLTLWCIMRIPKRKWNATSTSASEIPTSDKEQRA